MEAHAPIQNEGIPLAAAAARVPLYRQIADELMSAINKGDFSAARPLPSEHVLCRIFGVSRVTVRGALQFLVDKGMVERRHGAGTFVRTRDILRPLGALSSFRAEAERNGRKASTVLLSLTRRPAGLRERVALRIERAAHVVVLHRLRLLDGAPAVLQTSIVPADLIPTEADASLHRGSLYAYLADQKSAVTRARDVVEAVALSSADASRLRLPPGSPVFLFHRTGESRTGRVVEVSESLVRSDFYKLAFDPAGEISDG